MDDEEVGTVAAESAVSAGSTRLAYILGVPLADDVVREWPQMGEIVRGRDMIGAVEGHFEEFRLAVGGRRHLPQCDDRRDRRRRGRAGYRLLGQAVRYSGLARGNDGPARHAG